MVTSHDVDISPMAYLYHGLGYATIYILVSGSAWLYSAPTQTGMLGSLQEKWKSSAFGTWFCVAKTGESSGDQTKKQNKKPTFSYWTGLVIAFIGLQMCYLSWGFLQERIMTVEYDGDKFHDTEFLVLVNRISAVFIAYGIISYQDPNPTFAPPNQYVIVSVSNILSTWLQYEALKFVTFPMQVLSKSSKILFTMIMGYFVSRAKYGFGDYFRAGCISVGIAVYAIFDDKAKSDKNADMEQWKFYVGMFLLAGYICFDSFASNWQSKMFKLYKISPYQMMLGINTSSSLVLLSVLSSNGTLFKALRFVSIHPLCLTHCLSMSICSACGQLFIFWTIKNYGPVIFASIMTARQLAAICISIAVFEHHVSQGSLVGLCIVFATIFYNTGSKFFAKKPAVQNLSQEKNKTDTPSNRAEKSQNSFSPSSSGSPKNEDNSRKSNR